MFIIGCFLYKWCTHLRFLVYFFRFSMKLLLCFLFKELHRMHFDTDGIVQLKELRQVFDTVSFVIILEDHCHCSVGNHSLTSLFFRSDISLSLVPIRRYTFFFSLKLWLRLDVLNFLKIFSFECSYWCSFLHMLRFCMWTYVEISAKSKPECFYKQGSNKKMRVTSARNEKKLIWSAS